MINDDVMAGEDMCEGSGKVAHFVIVHSKVFKSQHTTKCKPSCLFSPFTFSYWLYNSIALPVSTSVTVYILHTPT
jgi:hypothetical protein